MSKELEMMDGSSSEKSYIVIGRDDKHEVGIKLSHSNGTTSCGCSAMLRVAVRPDVEVEEHPDWNTIFPGVSWERESPDRARTTVSHLVKGVSPYLPEAFNAALEEHGDFLMGPMLDEIFQRVPRNLKKGSPNSYDDIREAVFHDLKVAVGNGVPESQGVHWPSFNGLDTDDEDEDDEGDED